MLTEKAIRQHFAASVRRRREPLRAWIEAVTAAGGVTEIPSNAFAAILLALRDGLNLRATLDPTGFRWSTIRKALDVLLGGLSRS